MQVLVKLIFCSAVPTAAFSFPTGHTCQDSCVFAFLFDSLHCSFISPFFWFLVFIFRILVAFCSPCHFLISASSQSVPHTCCHFLISSAVGSTPIYQSVTPTFTSAGHCFDMLCLELSCASPPMSCYFHVSPSLASLAALLEFCFILLLKYFEFYFSKSSCSLHSGSYCPH